MFAPEQRGAAMSLVVIVPFLGSAIGPAVSGVVVEHLGWRAIFGIAAILAGTCELILLFVFRETFQVVILRRRAAKRRKETNDPAFRSVFEKEGAKKPALRQSMIRPFVIFFDSGILQALSLAGSVAFAYYYVDCTTLPGILANKHRLSPSQIGAAFLCFSVGCSLAAVLCNLTLDRIYTWLSRTSTSRSGQPEFRLPLAILANFSLPAVVMLYGWSAQESLPLPVLLLSVFLLGLCCISGTLPLVAYVVDAFGIYSASAVTAITVSRCLMATFLPLVAEPLIRKLGYGFAFTILSSISLFLAPIPLFLWRYGAKLRQNSIFTRQSGEASRLE